MCDFIETELDETLVAARALVEAGGDAKSKLDEADELIEQLQIDARGAGPRRKELEAKLKVARSESDALRARGALLTGAGPRGRQSILFRRRLLDARRGETSSRPRISQRLMFRREGARRGRPEPPRGRARQAGAAERDHRDHAPRGVPGARRGGALHLRRAPGGSVTSSARV